MKDKMDLLWGIEQLEKALSKNHSPASNILSICNEVEKQVSELIDEPAKLPAKIDKLIEHRNGERKNNNIFRMSADDLNNQFIEELEKLKEDD